MMSFYIYGKCEFFVKNFSQKILLNQIDSPQ